nr:MAG TPA: Integrase [Caudoviricetes sp.]
MLFSEAATEYMADKRKRLRATTLEGYESATRCHLLPRWGEREIETITFEQVQDWVDGFDLPGAAEKAYKTFRQVYRWVLRRHQLRIWDVTQGVELPNRPAARRPTLTVEQERTTLRAIEGQPFEAAVVLGAALGLRRCEACAVRIEDIDWRSGWVHVQRGLHMVKGELVETGCKTKLSDRRLKLPRFALERLRAIRGARRSGRLCELDPNTVARRFRAFCKRFQLPHVPMTCLRHSWATISLEHGAAIEDIAVALGHSTVNTAMSHYLQSFRTVVARASDSYTAAMEM